MLQEFTNVTILAVQMTFKLAVLIADSASSHWLTSALKGASLARELKV